MANQPTERVTWINKGLNAIEVIGNKLPDPALLFLILLFLTWGASYFLADIQFTEVNPKSAEPIQVVNQLSGQSLAGFLAHMVKEFTGFAPLGVVLVALLGVGVAEHTGFVNAGLKYLLNWTPMSLLTPMLILVAIVSHTAADAGYVLVIPLGGVIFYAAGRHPLAGIGAAFAGVSGGFSANFIPSGIDPLLQGLTQEGGRILDPALNVNPLCNIYFTGLSSIVVILVGWFLTDKIIEPRLKATAIDGDPSDMPEMKDLSPAEKRGLGWGLATAVLGLVGLGLWLWPQDSAMRHPAHIETQVTFSRQTAAEADIFIPAQTEIGAGEIKFKTSKEAVLAAGATSVTTTAEAVVVEDGSLVQSGAISTLAKPIWGVERVTNPESAHYTESSRKITDFHAPIMESIVPLIFLLFLLPGIVHGYVSGTAKNHRDIIKGMSNAMGTMSYYLVMAFFAAQFIGTFKGSNIGVLLAVKGANFLKDMGLAAQLTIVGIIILSACVNLLVGSASAKWALLSPIFVPMLMQLGISAELIQAAYRVGDSTTNIITPLMPYFPLVVVFCQRYVKGTGIGTVTALMLPYSIALFISWTAFLLIYWAIGIPLGLQATYTYTMVGG